jgi:hypothetical protein
MRVESLATFQQLPAIPRTGICPPHAHEDNSGRSLAMLTDPFDPNNWDLSEPVYRIYGDTQATIFAEVDEVDYHWAINWLWDVTTSRGKKGIKYIVRSVTQRNGAGRKGRAEEGRINTKMFLHVEIMKRTGILPPSPLHSMVDHIDRISLNCRRSNLQWATPSMNRNNISGGIND